MKEPDVQEKYNLLLSKVAALRFYQKEYFKTRSNKAFKLALKFEAEVDALVMNKPTSHQTQLPIL